MPWDDWLKAWLSLELRMDDFWTLSPAQIHFVFEARGAVQKKGSVSDFMGIAAKSGLGIDSDAADLLSDREEAAS